MILVLLAGFIFVEIVTCALSIDDLTFVKFGLVESLPGGLLQQVMVANSRVQSTVRGGLETGSEGLLVSSKVDFNSLGYYDGGRLTV